MQRPRIEAGGESGVGRPGLGQSAIGVPGLVGAEDRVEVVVSGDRLLGERLGAGAPGPEGLGHLFKRLVHELSHGE